MNKKLVLAVLSTTIILSSCSKSGGGGGTGTPKLTSAAKGYIRLNFSGKTLEASDSIVSGIFVPKLVSKLISNPNIYYPGKISKMVQLGTDYTANGDLKIVASFFIDTSNNNNPLDTYKLSYGEYKLTDKSTSTDYAIDSSSSITITQATDSFTVGTLNLKLRAGGTTKIPATGTFKIYSK